MMNDLTGNSKDKYISLNKCLLVNIKKTFSNNDELYIKGAIVPFPSFWVDVVFFRDRAFNFDYEVQQANYVLESSNVLFENLAGFIKVKEHEGKLYYSIIVHDFRISKVYTKKKITASKAKGMEELEYDQSLKIKFASIEQLNTLIALQRTKETNFPTERVKPVFKWINDIVELSDEAFIEKHQKTRLEVANLLLTSNKFNINRGDFKYYVVL